MRCVLKQGSAGFHLERAHAHPPADQVQAQSRWAAYGHKAELLERLCAEQFMLCCYSEIRPDLLGLGYHIEHVVPKSAAPLRTFDYANLAASALASHDGLAAFKQRLLQVFGGHAKGSDHDPALFISCHQSDSARFFAYLSDGLVVPAVDLDDADRVRAAYTIELLKLNSGFLVQRRRAWWDELDALFEDHLARDWDVQALAAVDLLPRSGALSEFFSLTRQFFGPVAQAVLQQDPA